MSNLDSRQKGICYYNRKGVCKFGNGCRFAHIGVPPPTPTADGAPARKNQKKHAPRNPPKLKESNQALAGPSTSQKQKKKAQGGGGRNVPTSSTLAPALAISNKGKASKHDTNGNDITSLDKLVSENDSYRMKSPLGTPALDLHKKRKDKGRGPALSHNHEDDLPKTITQTMGGNMSVTFEAGMNIQSIVSIDMGSILLSVVVENLAGPSSTEKQAEILEMVQNRTFFTHPSSVIQNITLVEKDEDMVDAIVRYNSSKAADYGVEVLSGESSQDPYNLVCKPLQSWMSARATEDSESVTKIECCWFLPSRIAFIVFILSETARAACVRSTVIKGHLLKTKLQPPRLNKPQSVMLIGIPLDITADDIERAFPECIRVDLKEPRYRLTIPETVNKIKEAFGGNENITIVSPPNNSRQKGLITFTTPGEAQEMYEENKDKPQIFLGGAKLELRLNYNIKFEIGRDIYGAITKEIESIISENSKGNSRATNPTLRVRNWHGLKRTVVVYGEDREVIARVKASIQKLVRGKVVCDEHGQALWDRALGYGEGKQLVQATTRRSGVYAYCDARNRIITLYGSPSAIDKAREDLQIAYILFNSNTLHEIPLSGALIKNALKGGFAEVKKLLGPSKVQIDFLNKLVFVRCSSSELESVKRILLGQSTTSSSSFSSSSASAAVEAEDCPVCLTPTEDDAVEAPCGHSYCGPCLRGYFDSALTSRTFPLRCIHSSNGSCNSAFSLPFLHKFLPRATFDTLLSTAFSAYIQSRPQDYHFCPTPDCETVYLAPLTNTITNPIPVSCQTCFTTICTSCRTPAHPPHSCAVYQNILNSETKFVEWRNGAENNVKPCPRCGVHIEKVDGCSHVKCVVCNAHMCFSCTPPRKFEYSTQVYAHMKVSHPYGEPIIRQQIETETESNWSCVVM